MNGNHFSSNIRTQILSANLITLLVNKYELAMNHDMWYLLRAYSSHSFFRILHQRHALMRSVVIAQIIDTGVVWTFLASSYNDLYGKRWCTWWNYLIYRNLAYRRIIIVSDESYTSKVDLDLFRINDISSTLIAINLWILPCIVTGPMAKINFIDTVVVFLHLHI